MHVANRHAERWAPEAGAQRVRPLRTLGFVDRLVTPWLESAQRSPSLRMFSKMQTSGANEHGGKPVSWVFPRPWYQDEIDWMAAARQAAGAQATSDEAPTLLTTRGTYVSPATRASNVPMALHEYIAPSLSVAPPHASGAAYSPLVPFAAANAAEVMSRAMAPLASPTMSASASPGLRSLLTTLLQRAGSPTEVAPTRTSLAAPELVTPPSPRAPDDASPEGSPAESNQRVIEDLAAQRVRVADVQRAAISAAAVAQASAAQQRIEAELRQRASDARDTRESQQRRETTRLHDQARDAAARDAAARDVRRSPESLRAPASTPAAIAPAGQGELAQAIAALPPGLASYLSQRPDRAVQAIGELGDALRAAELVAMTAATGGTIESSRGPRLVMPAGLGGLVSMIDRTPPSRAGGQPIGAPRLPLPFAASAPPATALAATAASKPAALGHVAWADRWLARFAGAAPRTLRTLAGGSVGPVLPATAAPLALGALAASAPAAVFVAPDAAPTAAQTVRIADDAETPDDMFASIAQAAGRTRVPPRPAAAKPFAPTQTQTPRIDAPAADRATHADAIARTVPSAPGAGLSAQLASSPFAPALRHVLPIGSAPSFDVRALFGGELSASYLTGFLAPATEVAAADAPSARSWEATYVSGDESAAPAVDVGDAAGQAPTLPVHGEQIEHAPLLALHSALLAWQASPAARAAAPTSAPAPTAARAMLDTLTQPMIGDGSDAGGSSWAAPGMVADRAAGYAVAHERSTSDLAFDFVMPELVLAARVYGLGPAEAAQAARLSLVGPGQLSAMASTVNRTFVEMMALDAQRHGDRAITAYPVGDAGEPRPPEARPPEAQPPDAQPPDAQPATTAFGVARRMPRGAFLWPASTVGALGMAAAAPDGAHSMSVAALELLAAQAVVELGTYPRTLGAPSDPTAATAGATAATAGATAATAGATAATAGATAANAGATAANAGATAANAGATAANAGATVAKSGAASPFRTDPRVGGDRRRELAEADVLDAAASLVPTGRRAKFEALYLALSQSTLGRSSAPAARAARALALAGRGDDVLSPRERAAIAWDVLPVVIGVGDETLSTGQAAEHDARVAAADRTTTASRQRSFEPAFVRGETLGADARPGLSVLSARAGEALASYVAPPAAQGASSSLSSSTSSSSSSAGAMSRVPTAANEFVRTGRPTGRHGGGEVEIPPWFEAAARKMLEARSAPSDGISLAELTLVSSAPATQIAASTRSPSSAAPPLAAPSGTQASDQQVDVDRIANDVYREVLALMDVARARNGEPHI